MVRWSVCCAFGVNGWNENVWQFEIVMRSMKIKLRHGIHTVFLCTISHAQLEAVKIWEQLWENQSCQNFFPFSLEMTRKTADINDKFNNQPVFTSMCIYMWEQQWQYSRRQIKAHCACPHLAQHCTWLCGDGLLWLPQVLEILCIGQKVRQDLEYRNLYVHAWL